jgi:23S rRNA pseudouridine2605 synthase
VSERLQKVLAAAGLGSRRACEELIRAGRVTVDGEVAALGTSVEPGREDVRVDGRPIEAEPPEYWLLNKPVGVVSTSADTHGRPTVVQLIPSALRVFPVGRLDQETSGVLLLTNDGVLANRLLHPRHGVEKEYLVRIAGEPTASDVRRLREGIRLDEGLTSPAQVTVRGRRAGLTDLSVVIHQGWKRQVRHMFEAVGCRVLSLHRVRFDGLTDVGLEPGESRLLTADEVDVLRVAAGLDRLQDKPQP